MRLRDCQGNFITFRAFIDGGAMTNFMTYKAAKLLNIPASDCYREVTSFDVSGINVVKKELNGVMMMNHQERLMGKMLTKNWSLVKNIPLILPPVKLEVEITEEVQGKLRLADPQFRDPHGIDLLIGGAIWGALKRQRFIWVEDVVFQNSMLGHVAFGAAQVCYPVERSIVSTIMTGHDWDEIRGDL